MGLLDCQYLQKSPEPPFAKGGSGDFCMILLLAVGFETRPYTQG
jgi:hypothetical protein